jgi:hypothetical protein
MQGLPTDLHQYLNRVSIILCLESSNVSTLLNLYPHNARLLVEKGANLLEASDEGFTLLHIAAGTQCLCCWQ